MRRITVSELLDWRKCRRMWQYHYRDGLRKVARDGDIDYAVSGRAIHFGVETGLLTSSARHVAAHDAADVFIDANGIDEKYRKGVHTAINGVPEALWALPYPQVETELVAEVLPDVIVVGKPDLWYVTDEGVFIDDFKSSSSDEDMRQRNNQLWNDQLRWYGAITASSVFTAAMPIYTRYVFLSTRGKHAPGLYRLLNVNAARLSLADAIADLLAGETGPCPPINSPSFCPFCDYADIDAGVLTGADIGDIIREGYTKKESTP